MAGTLKPDPAFQRFNAAKESYGTYFRFTPKSIAFNLLMMGAIPAGLAYYAYSSDGQSPLRRLYRTSPILGGEEYVPRDKDL